MRSISKVMTLLCFLTGAAVTAQPEDTAAAGKLSLSGKLEFEAAELIKARLSPWGAPSPGMATTVDHIWFGHTIGTINLASSPSENFKVRTGFEFRQYMTMQPMTLGTNDPFFGNTYWNGFYVRECQGIFSLLKNESVAVEMAIGLMPYKYNAEVRDLGEFLFRSGTYPLFLLGEFDRPFARLTGLRLSAESGNDDFGWKFDWLALIERTLRPFNDVSLAAVMTMNFLKMVTIGGGVDFSHGLPMNSHVTTLIEDRNKYQVKNAFFNSDSTVDSIVHTGYYTFKGTKLTVHATIDPLRTLRGNSESFIGQLFGENGGTLYAEFAVIGLENYPGNANINPRGYGKAAERSPWMAGFTIPAWKLLDVCALEFERYPGYLPDSYYRPVINGWPLPTDRNSNSAEGYDSSTYQPRWLWSLYMKKQIVKHFSLVCEMGRNHQRWEFNQNEGFFYDFETALVKPDQWGWHLSGVFSF